MNIFVARQPIFNTRKQVVAYEILYRSNFKNVYDVNQDADVATVSVVTDALTSFGLDKLTGGKRAFINFTDTLIKEDLPKLFKPDELVIEILETATVDRTLVEKCRELSDAGYQIALDDFAGGHGFDAVMPYVKILKVDFMVLKTAGRKYMAEKYEASDVLLLAEKVETIEDYNEALELGYKLFQGFFFERPVVYQGKGLSISTYKYLEILKETVNEEADFMKLTDIIESDLSLTYKLLRLINSPAFYTINEIKSVQHALTLLGIQEIRKWTTLIMLREIGEAKPNEVIRISLVRAVFAEKLAKCLIIEDRKTEAFLMGLFSVIDTLMEKPLYDILEDLPLSEDIKGALLGGDNTFHLILKMLKYYEVANWDMVIQICDLLGLDYDYVNELYMKSISEATHRMEQM
ncbi:EAL and HDOD domain-containing protein [Fusibacter tunisiensis]|uniref:EAL and modified HD-GYP domain-containing signal transduction protein n=1 Tax=Fusibacter tunisiensis TaxID=1008308 RepID=A0ABS2MPQ0_9FIRM|nr:HDOD domain-containing protein [Fusibacter tunisiensis]MBM7561366.1 EAL and modified HD-GYP domain-containing signal transduction protein [Fusibacter tunisiensis]